MAYLLALCLSASLTGVAYYGVKALSQESLRLKWFTSFEEEKDIFWRWNRPWISLLTPFFNGKKIWAWSFILSLEFSLFVFLLFGVSVFSLLVGLLLGVGYPFLSRRWEEKSRLQQIQRELPLLMDMLAIAVMAGMEMMQAIERFVRYFPPSLLTQELESLLKGLRLGKSRRDALVDLKKRILLSEIQVFVSLLLQTMELGSPLAPVLLANADQIRTTRLLKAEKKGIQAAQKILFPLIFCMMPAVFLAIFGPIFIRWLHGDLFNWL